jgi:hypothetical protein
MEEEEEEEKEGEEEEEYRQAVSDSLALMAEVAALPLIPLVAPLAPLSTPSQLSPPLPASLRVAPYAASPHPHIQFPLDNDEEEAEEEVGGGGSGGGGLEGAEVDSLEGDSDSAVVEREDYSSRFEVGEEEEAAEEGGAGGGEESLGDGDGDDGDGDSVVGDDWLPVRPVASSRGGGGALFFAPRGGDEVPALSAELLQLEALAAQLRVQLEATLPAELLPEVARLVGGDSAPDGADEDGGPQLGVRVRPQLPPEAWLMLVRLNSVAGKAREVGRALLRLRGEGGGAGGPT